MTMLPHRLDRDIVIRAKPATVFEFLTNPDDWARWWGAGSTIDARPGGRMLIRHPNGIEVSGEVIEVRPPDRLVFSYGYVSGSPIPPGGSEVTIRLNQHPDGTLLLLTHDFRDVEPRDQHVQGWRFQLSLFANAIANKSNASASSTVDDWFLAWSTPETAAREQVLDRISASGIRFQDMYSSIGGEDELKAHLAAVHRFMPGMRLERQGPVRHCQWRVLADWTALSADGQVRGRGTNLFLLTAEGKVAEVTGFWMPAAV